MGSSLTAQAAAAAAAAARIDRDHRARRRVRRGGRGVAHRRGDALGDVPDEPFEIARKTSEAELKGVEGGVSGLKTARGGGRRDTVRVRREVKKSLRIGVHHANAVVWGPVR